MVWIVSHPECMANNTRNTEYEDISCIYSWSDAFYMPWELSPPYEIEAYYWMRRNSWFPILIVALYITLIFAGKAYFADKKPWNWRTTLAVWNFSLSLFSFVGASRTILQAYHNWTSYSLRDNFCHDPIHTFGSGVTGRWVFYFVISKFPELFDTFFIIIHKKPLIFLHWYHHVTVLLYCWHAYVLHSSTGIYFAAMNFTVHALMYGYYFLMCIKKKPKFLNAMFLTCLQLGQMIIGIIITIMAEYFRHTHNQYADYPCHLTDGNSIAAVILYGSYFLLFLHFFVGRYYFKTTTMTTMTTNTTTKHKQQ